MARKSLYWFVMLSAVACFSSSSVFAKQCGSDFCFEPQESVSGMSLPLRGAVKYRFLGFSIYQAALYAKTQAVGAAKVLVLRYDRAISKQDFLKSSEKILSRDPNIDLQEIRDPMQQFFALIRSVEAGDEYAMEFVPGKGIALYLNKRLLGRVAEDRFAQAYLNIWLGQHGIDSDKAQELRG